MSQTVFPGHLQTRKLAEYNIIALTVQTDKILRTNEEQLIKIYP